MNDATPPSSYSDHGDSGRPKTEKKKRTKLKNATTRLLHLNKVLKSKTKETKSSVSDSHDVLTATVTASATAAVASSRPRFVQSKVSENVSNFHKQSSVTSVNSLPDPPTAPIVQLPPPSKRLSAIESHQSDYEERIKRKLIQERQGATSAHQASAPPTRPGATYVEERTSVPGASSASGASTVDERLRRKLEQSRPIATTAMSAGAASKVRRKVNVNMDAYEEKLKQKMEKAQQVTGGGRAASDSQPKHAVGGPGKNQTALDAYSDKMKKKMEMHAPPIAAQRSSKIDDYEERLRNKMEQSGKPSVYSGAEKSSPGASPGISAVAKEDYSERLRQKMEQGGKPSYTSQSSSTGEKAGASPGISAVSKGDYSERLRKKMEQGGKPSYSSQSSSTGDKSTPGASPRMAAVSMESYSERMRKKMEESNAGRRKLEASGDRRPGMESYEERMRRKIQARSKRKEEKEGGRVRIPRMSLQVASAPAIATVQPRLYSADDVDGVDLDERLRRRSTRRTSLEDSESDLDGSTRRKDSSEDLTLEERIAQKRAKKKRRDKQKETRSGVDGTDEKEKSKKEHKKKHRKKDKEKRRKKKSSKDTKEKAIADLQGPESAEKGMLRRSMRTGFVQTSSRRIMAGLPADMPDNNKSNTSRDVTRSHTMVRSLSSGNLVAGSWECPSCTYVNEPVGVVPREMCRVCNTPSEELNDAQDDVRDIVKPKKIAALDLPKKTEKEADTLQDLPSSSEDGNKSWAKLRRVAKDKSQRGMSWSDLGDILGQTLDESMGEIHDSAGNYIEGMLSDEEDEDDKKPASKMPVLSEHDADEPTNQKMGVDVPEPSYNNYKSDDDDDDDDYDDDEDEDSINLDMPLSENRLRLSYRSECIKKAASEKFMMSWSQLDEALGEAMQASTHINANMDLGSFSSEEEEDDDDEWRPDALKKPPAEDSVWECVKCERQNLDSGAKFCGECGTPRG